MAVSTTNAISGPFLTNGATVAFPFTLTAPSPDEVSVILVDEDGEAIAADGYTVALDAEGGGTATFDVAPAAGYDLYVLLDPDFTQDIQFENGSRWLAGPVNEANDRAAARDQWLKARIERIVPDEALFGNLAGKFLAWDADGNPTPSAGTGADAGLRTDLAATTGGSLIGWLSSRTGAALRSIADIFEDRHSVMDYIPLATRVQIRLRTVAADLSGYFDQAMGNMPNGGVLYVPDGLFPIFKATVPYDDIYLSLSSGTTLLRHSAGTNNGVGSSGKDRGMFLVEGRDRFTIDCNGATLDLNGEGPLGIGVDGRIPNNYGVINPGLGIYGLNGPANGLIYGLRSSRIRVLGPFLLKNSGEDGLHLKNCGDCLVDGGDFENIANFGVEFSYIPGSTDGSSADMPDLGGTIIRKCTFTDINDYSLGTGNGVAVGGGGGGARQLGEPPSGPFYAHNLGPIRGDWVLDNKFTRCIKDVQFEVPYAPAPGEVGTTIVGGRINGNTSYRAGQVAVALIGCVDWDLTDFLAYDPCSVVNPALGPNWPSSAGIVISSRCERMRIGEGVRVIETHGLKGYKATDGEILSGSRGTMTSASAAFDADYIGEEIGILGVGEHGGDVLHLATITAVPSANTVNFTPEAPNAGTGLTYAYGRACRVGLDVTNATSVEKLAGVYKAGSYSGMPGEPTESAAVKIKGLVGYAKIESLTCIAPPTAGAHPNGIMIDTSVSMIGLIHPDTNSMRVEGFSKQYGGFHEDRAFIASPVKSYVLDRSLAPGAGANTYGSAEVLVPHTGAVLTDVLRGSFEATEGPFDVAETVTFKIQAIHDDVDGPEVEIDVTDLGVEIITPRVLKEINPEHALMRAVSVAMKSSKAGSAVRGLANVSARQ